MILSEIYQLKNTKTTSFALIKHPGFIIDEVISESTTGNKEYEYWLYNSNYGIKTLLWGTNEPRIPKTKQIEEFIQYYKEDYMI